MTDRASESDVATDALVECLEDVLDVAVARTEVLADGLNLVVGVWTGDTAPSFVVRRPTLFRETASFNDLATEYRVLADLTDTPVPAPAPVHYCADRSILDGPFTISTSLPGETIPLGSDLPERFRTPTPSTQYERATSTGWHRLRPIPGARPDENSSIATRRRPESPSRPIDSTVPTAPSCSR